MAGQKQITQLQVANDSVQDRLILRIATQANEEIRVFITRRFLRELWPHLATMLSGHLAQRPTVIIEADSASPQPPSFEKPFRDDNPSYPLGSTPLLASEATLEAAGDGLARLVLREGRERSFNFNLKPATSTHYEGGLKAYFGADSRLDLAIFQINTKDELVVDDSVGGRTSYKNGGQTTRRGLELASDSRWAGNLSSRLA